MTYTVAVCTVKETPDDGQRNCPKHVEFYFHCYTVHVVELLSYYTNHCTYIKFIKFTH